MILESAETKWLGVGVVFKDYDLNLMPGWKDGTVGYHTDDRKIFDAEMKTRGKKTTGKGSSILINADPLIKKKPFPTIILGTCLSRPLMSRIELCNKFHDFSRQFQILRFFVMSRVFVLK